MALQVLGERGARYGPGAEVVQVLRGHLAIDEREAPFMQLAHQGGETDFRGVVGATEHGFAKEQLPHGQAIEAADQLVIEPDLDRVGDAALMQLQVGILHALGDPGAVGVAAWPCAGVDHSREILVEADAVALLTQQLGQATRNMQLVGEQHGARVR